MARTHSKQTTHRAPRRRNFEKIYSIPRMTPSVRRRPNPQVTSQTGPDPGLWGYNGDLCLILHNSSSCELCHTWLGHFTDSVMAKDESLKTARHALNSTGGHNLQTEVDNAQRTRDEVFQKIATVRRELDLARDNLRRARRDRDTSMVTNKELQSESLGYLKSRVVQLCHTFDTTCLNSPRASAASSRSSPSQPIAPSSTI
jgi:hypothetical protein